MVKRSELEAKIKEKILLTGGTGVGKTFTSVRIAEHVVKAGKSVVYVDPEFGCERELELLSDEVLDKIDLKITPEWKGFKYEVLKDQRCFLKIVDGLSEAYSLAKFFLIDRFVRTGKYMIGESEKEIKDKDTFTLPWESYPKVYDGLREICQALMKQRSHMICTMHLFEETKTKKKLEEDIFRKFDTVIDLSKTLDMTSGDLTYGAHLIKHRGKGIAGRAILRDHVGQLRTLFNKRLGIVEEEEEEVEA